MSPILVVAIVILFVLVGVYSVAKWRENIRENALAANALHTRERLAEDIHKIFVIVNTIANSSPCEECGRIASGERRKQEEQKS